MTRERQTWSIVDVLSLILAAAVLLVTAVLPALAQEAATPNEEEYAKDSNTEINVKNADIAAIVRIFSKKTKRNYILDENVKGKVSIYLPGKVSSDEAIRILDAVLALKGFSPVPIGENLWKIVYAKDAKQSTIPTITDENAKSVPSSAVVTRLVNLKYVKAEDLQQLLSQLISPNGLLNAYTGTNSLLLIDSEDNVERLVKIVHSLDVPFSNREMTIIPIKHADVADIGEKLQQILGDGSKDSGANELARLSANSGNPAAAAAAAMRANNAAMSGMPAGGAAPLGGASSQTVSAKGLEPKIIADERTNSIIVVADEDTTARIRALISQLDSEVDLSGNRFYVYRCQHANAEDIADVLSGLTGGSSGGGSSRSSSSGIGSSGGGSDGLANPSEPYGLGGSSANRNTGSRNRGGRSSQTTGRNTNQQRTPGRSRSENRAGGAGAANASFGEDISITADPATNSLIINAGKTDYEKILSLLQKLDIKRRQVLVEAILLEVGVDDQTTLGTEFLASTGGKDGGAVVKSDFGNLATLFSDPTKLSGFSMAAASSGTLSLPGGVTIPTQSILVSAARRNNNVNVLSAPNILATDNEQAEIVVGQNVPFLASVATSETNLNNTFNQIDRQDVGITLRLTPQISSRDFVTLNIFTEVSNVVAVSPELGPTTTIRTSETTVITKDGQMIVIGGLMADAQSDAQSGVPFFEEIPVLGHLFRLGNAQERRTNLLMFITPKIIKDQFDARDATIVNRDKLEDVIAFQQNYPDRHEILHADEIDHVSESSLYEGEKPGTIFPPARKKVASPRMQEEEAPPANDAALNQNKENPPAAVESGAVRDSASENSEDEEAIELEAAPSLPSEQEEPVERLPAGTGQTVKNSEAAFERRASLRPLPIKIESSPRAKYVVLQVKNGEKVPASAPFKAGQRKGSTTLAAIVVPEGSSSQAKEFFRTGDEYDYKLNDGKLTLRPMGIFESTSDAERLYPEVAKLWYTLSPYEIMNLGSSPWVSR